MQCLVDVDDFPSDGEAELREMGVLDRGDSVMPVSRETLRAAGPSATCLAAFLRDLAKCGVKVISDGLLSLPGGTCILKAARDFIHCLNQSCESDED